MKKCFLTVAVSVFLLSCTDIGRDNPYDMLASNYIPPKEGSSSSVAAGNSSSSVETGNSSSSSSNEKPSSNSVVPEPINAGSPLSFTNANYTEDGNKYYWLGTTPVVKKDLVIQNMESAKCNKDIGIRYEQSPEIWNINSPGKISICAKAVCNEQPKILECAEAEFLPNPSLSGTCDWTETGESPVVASEDIIPQIDISIQNSYGRCEEDIKLSPDGVSIWTPPSSWSWQAETANLLTSIKAYAKCSGSLIGGIACPKIKIKNPKTTDYIVDDRDGQAYQIVEIDEQTWMAENLNYNASGSKCYNNSEANCEKYGKLYNWATAMNNSASSTANPSGVRGVCPVGWHLPSKAEWEVMITYIGGATEVTKLKATSGWNNNSNGTDDYGFSALPGGGGGSDGSFVGTAVNVGEVGGWWSATETTTTTTSAYCLRIPWNYNAGWPGYVKASFRSVRCLQDSKR
jgi:uncharacterized protein (TIGR02145 family)